MSISFYSISIKIASWFIPSSIVFRGQYQIASNSCSNYIYTFVDTLQRQQLKAICWSVTIKNSDWLIPVLQAIQNPCLKIRINQHRFKRIFFTWSMPQVLLFCLCFASSWVIRGYLYDIPAQGLTLTRVIWIKCWKPNPEHRYLLPLLSVHTYIYI